jgi:hypothetical protein
MVPTAQRWNMIVDKFQKIIHAKIPRNVKMCKDKWNGLNSYYKKLSNYHKGTSHHTLLWEMILEEHNQYYLRRQFNKEFYEAIEAFQGKWIIIVPIHVRDLQEKGEEILLRQCLNQTHMRNKILHNINLSHKSFLVMIM